MITGVPVVSGNTDCILGIESFSSLVAQSLEGATSINGSKISFRQHCFLMQRRYLPIRNIYDNPKCRFPGGKSPALPKIRMPNSKEVRFILMGNKGKGAKVLLFYFYRKVIRVLIVSFTQPCL